MLTISWYFHEINRCLQKSTIYNFISLYMAIIQLFLSYMEITPKMISNLLHLARLEAIPGKEASLQKDLEKMVGFIEQLNEVNTDGVAPLLYLNPAMRLRADQLTAGVSREAALANSPVPDTAYFKVPTVIKK